MWAIDITNFVFWVGIAHSGTLISAVLFLFRVRWRASIYRAAEAVTVFALMTAALFPIIHLGRPWYVYWLLPYPQVGGLWPNFRSPLIWDVFAVLTYMLVSMVFFFTAWCLISPLFGTSRAAGVAACTASWLKAGRGPTGSGGITPAPTCSWPL